jgi:hypothetical protein
MAADLWAKRSQDNRFWILSFNLQNDTSPPNSGGKHSPADGCGWGVFVVGLIRALCFKTVRDHTITQFFPIRAASDRLQRRIQLEKGVSDVIHHHYCPDRTVCNWLPTIKPTA